MLSLFPPKPSDIQEQLRQKFKTRRKQRGYTQSELSERSGVSLGSLKRFETTGQISLESLLKLAFVLECLGEFEKVCTEEEESFQSIEEVLR
jgi:transcriptional regulator with XRE-family HTH domain